MTLLANNENPLFVHGVSWMVLLIVVIGLAYLLAMS